MTISEIVNYGYTVTVYGKDYKELHFRNFFDAYEYTKKCVDEATLEPGDGGEYDYVFINDEHTTKEQALAETIKYVISYPKWRPSWLRGGKRARKWARRKRILNQFNPTKKASYSESAEINLAEINFNNYMIDDDSYICYEDDSEEFDLWLELADDSSFCFTPVTGVPVTGDVDEDELPF